VIRRRETQLQWREDSSGCTGSAREWHCDGPGTSRRDEREHFFGNVGIVADIGPL